MSVAVSLILSYLLRTDPLVAFTQDSECESAGNGGDEGQMAGEGSQVCSAVTNIFLPGQDCRMHKNKIRLRDVKGHFTAVQYEVFHGCSV